MGELEVMGLFLAPGGIKIRPFRLARLHSLGRSRALPTPRHATRRRTGNDICTYAANNP
eukprot:COSAG06_NODE_35_length_30757_cov_53.112532_19_plen_59_part_00